MDQEDENSMMNGQDAVVKTIEGTPVSGSLKRKLKDYQNKLLGRKNFDFISFRDPVLFIGHLSKSAILMIDKPWMEVVKTFEAPPIHKNIFGT